MQSTYENVNSNGNNANELNSETDSTPDNVNSNSKEIDSESDFIVMTNLEAKGAIENAIKQGYTLQWKKRLS